MSSFIKSLLAGALAIGISGSALAQEYTKGVVTKIDTAQKKLTIDHEELKNLDMPGMKMVFVVAEGALLDKAKVGQPIEFIAERVNGRLTVVEIK